MWPSHFALQLCPPHPNKSQPRNICDDLSVINSVGHITRHFTENVRSSEHIGDAAPSSTRVANCGTTKNRPTTGTQLRSCGGIIRAIELTCTYGVCTILLGCKMWVGKGYDDVAPQQKSTLNRYLKGKSAKHLALFLQLHWYIHPQRILLKSVYTNCQQSYLPHLREFYSLFKRVAAVHPLSVSTYRRNCSCKSGDF